MEPSRTTSHLDIAARRNIDTAVGILVGLRRCTQQEAFTEIADAVHQTGLPLGDLADALIALARRSHAGFAHHNEAERLWGDLLTSR